MMMIHLWSIWIDQVRDGGSDEVYESMTLKMEKAVKYELIKLKREGRDEVYKLMTLKLKEAMQYELMKLNLKEAMKYMSWWR